MYLCFPAQRVKMSLLYSGAACENVFALFLHGIFAVAHAENVLYIRHHA